MMKILKPLLNVGFCDNVYADGEVKVRDRCHITRKYRGSAHRDSNISILLNQKILIVFHNLRNYDSHLIIQVVETRKIH